MSTDARKQHLTDVEFSDLLAGVFAGAAAEHHLASCDHCQRELNAVQGSLSSFHDLGTAWAQVEAPRRVPVFSRLTLRLGMRPSWGAGLAATGMGAMLAFAMGLPSAHRLDKAVAAPQSVAPTTAELAKDNRLMLSINAELSDQAQPAVPTAELRSDDAHHTEHRADAPVLD